MRNRKNGGFTMAEMLAAVAILVVLFAVVAVNVAERQRAMTRLEFDTIAKEIFIAAQNHLTAAEMQNYLGVTEFGEDAPDPDESEEEAADKEAYYFVYPDSAGSAMLKQMLPDYALDSTVLAGGSYIIRYQPHPARVLDVFYSKEGKSGLLGASGTTLSDSDYDTLMSTCRDVYEDGALKVDNKANRERYNGSVVGWYGGDGAVAQGKPLLVPTLEIINAEQLYVKVYDPNDQSRNYKLKLVVESVSGNGQKVIPLKGETLDPVFKIASLGEGGYSILLDDITESGLHFSELFTTADGFKPGEDIKVYVVAYSTEELTNIAKSQEPITNSLFADPEPAFAPEASGTEVRYSKVDDGVAGIANFRHLENLDKTVSAKSADVAISKAYQTSDMDWTAAWTEPDYTGAAGNWTSATIVGSEGTALTGEGCLYPVSPNTALSYSGNPPASTTNPSTKDKGRVIKNVKVDYDGGPAGLFGTLPANSAVKDLELIDFDVKSTDGDAGALIGSSGNAEIENVLARNNESDDASREISGTENTGGLIGKMVGGKVTNCAAALYVTGGGDAGGLIGNASGVTIKSSYAGGHTSDGKYLSTTSGAARVNVISTGGNAGGLIGSSAGTVENCYSTCSVLGAGDVGGLIGNASGTVTKCYATGLVADAPNSNRGAFVGAGSATGSGNKYLWIINQDQAWHKAVVEAYKNDSAAAEASIRGPVAAEDATAAGNGKTATEVYLDFLSGTADAKPYDGKLKTSYGGKYPMRSVKDLGGSVADQYVAVHYGDWPMPETLVVN